jgi:hypothetical protein
MVYVAELELDPEEVPQEVSSNEATIARARIDDFILTYI